MSTSAFAQNTDASLSGSVLDSTGAAIPQVKITLTNDDTRLSQSVVSSDSGNFVLTPLPPGHYTVSAERDGFRRHVQSGILLTVAQKATLNLTLQVGNASEIVSVNSTPEMINATSPDLSTIVDARAIQELPLNGRDPSTLVLLAPGMTNGLRLGPAGDEFLSR
ncbi:MAG TPA: carboxypeptidase-like regulatory domain-containing protein [Edaphobacter sp.]|nr:carboxypeptidase-like regulatory domain-containing protein [Edaphobacter sp.]